MSSLYIHIPYCKKLCYYCDFHFSVNLKTKQDFITALCNELEIQKDFLKSNILDTIYFGGGTPSVLSKNDIKTIFSQIEKFWKISPTAEITFECNPDDLTETYLSELYSLGINRLSIGIQSFFDTDLQVLNRRHTSEEAIQCIQTAQKVGFTNISIDLMYGLPQQTIEHWKKNLDIVSQFNIQHISCYALTVEKNTALAHFVKQGKIKVLSDEAYIDFYTYLLKWSTIQGIEQYELSNFAKTGYNSKHNSNYWSGLPYLGIGPSAHSFNGTQRFWNISHNQKYIDSLVKHSLHQESEILSEKEICNEYIMTSLRTTQGIQIAKIKKLMDSNEYVKFQKTTLKLAQTNLVEISDSYVRCTSEGFMVSDMIITELFI